MAAYDLSTASTSPAPNTLFLRLEGPLQAWGDHRSKFIVRRTAKAPTKSGVIGILCAALGVPRSEVAKIAQLAGLRMAARLDAPGFLWSDYNTVGAKRAMPTAEGKLKEETMITYREYLCDASFLVALQGDHALIAELAEAVQKPKWTLYLGRKSCPPSRPIFESYPSKTSKSSSSSSYPSEYSESTSSKPLESPPSSSYSYSNCSYSNPAYYPDLLSAITAIPWRPRLEKDLPPKTITCLLDRDQESQPLAQEPTLHKSPPPELLPPPTEPSASAAEPSASAAEPSAEQNWPEETEEIWYDVPVTFDPPAHLPRIVIRKILTVGDNGQIKIDKKPSQSLPQPPPRPRANYTNSEYKKRRKERLKYDYNLCVFCKAPATTVQHITYSRAGGHEAIDDLRSLCRLCHDAVTMIEYGLGMGLHRINPEEERWRQEIIKKRAEIIKFRSLSTRRRRLAPEEV